MFSATLLKIKYTEKGNSKDLKCKKLTRNSNIFNLIDRFSVSVYHQF